MELLFKILFLVVIGAIIGGVTNSLAIKMLFRPYRPVYIGRWKLPFTPGLIPKRRADLAEQLGKTVMEHLLTPESIQRKLHDTEFQHEVIEWAQKEARKLLESDQTLAAMLEREFDVTGLKEQVDEKIDTAVRSVFENMYGRTLEDVFPARLLARIDEKISVFADHIADASANYVQSPEGRVRLQAFIDQFFSGRGRFAGMLQMFLGNSGMGDKIQAELVKLLRQPMFRTTVAQLLENEWGKLKKRHIDELPIGAVAEEVSAFVKRQVPTERWLETPLSESMAPYRDKVIEKWVPRLVDWAGKTLSARIGDLLQYLHLEEVVKAQVETFAVERLEELVLSISRREFKMITYLGALLGGVIGLVQGIVIQLFG